MRDLYHGRRNGLEKGRVQQYLKVLNEGCSAAEGPAIMEGYKGKDSSVAEGSAMTEGSGESKGKVQQQLTWGFIDSCGILPEI